MATAEEQLGFQTSILRRIEAYAKMTADNTKQISTQGSKKPMGSSAGIFEKGMNLKEFGEGVLSLGKGISSIVAGLVKFSIVPDSGNGFLNFIERFVKILDGRDFSGIDEFGNFLLTLENVMLGFATKFNQANTILASVGDVASSKFIQTIEGFAKKFSEMDTESLSTGAKAVEILKKSIFGFAVGLALSTPFFIIGLPGTVMFSLTIALILSAVKLIGPTENSIAVLNAIKNLGVGVLILGLAIFAYSKLISFGDVLFFSISLTMLMAPILLFEVLNSKFNKDKDKKFISGLGGEFQKIGFGMLILGLAMFAFDKLVTVGIMIKTIGFIAGMATAMVFWGTPLVQKGANSFRSASISILIFGLSVFAFDKLVGGIESGRLLKLGIVLGLTGVVFAGLGLIESQIKKGAMSMLLVGASLIVLGIGIAAFKAGVGDFSPQSVNNMLYGIGVLVGLGAVYFLAGTLAPTIIMGSLAFGVLGLSLLPLSLGLAAFTASLPSDLSIGWVGSSLALVGGIGVAFSVAGLVSPLIIAGSAAMAIAGVALFSISSGLQSFSKTTFTEQDSNRLDLAMSAIRRHVGGVDGIIGTAASMAAVPAIIANSAAMVVAGKALSSISVGLNSFKQIGFQQSDADQMNYAISSIVNSFTTPFKNLQNAFLIRNGVYALKNAGDTLSSLAQGVKAFANLSVVNYKIQDGKIVPDTIVKMTEQDFELASFGMARVISAVSEPFANVGKLEMGVGISEQTAGSKLLTSIFGGGYVSLGIKSLAGSGRILTVLAKSISEFAGLTFTEYTVANPGKPNAKIVPLAIHKLTQNDIDEAVSNMGKVVSATGEVFAEIGRVDSGGQPLNPALSFLGGLFGTNGLVGKGIKALKGSSSILAGLAKAIPNYANMQFLEYEVVGAGTKDAKVVPKGYITIGADEILNAKTNMIEVLTTVASAFAKIGEMEENSEGVFSGGFVKKGVDALKGSGDMLVKFASVMKSFAMLEFSQTDKNGNVVGTPVKLDSAMIEQVRSNIYNMLTGTIKAIIAVGEYVKNNEKSVSNALIKIPETSNAVSKIVDVLKSSVEIFKPDFVKGVNSSITSFINAVYDAFSSKVGGNFLIKHATFTSFVANISKLSEQVSAMNSIAKSFDNIANSVGKMSKSISSIEFKKIEKMAEIFSGAAELMADQTSATFQFISEAPARTIVQSVSAPTQTEAGASKVSEDGLKQLAAAINAQNAQLAALNAKVANLSSEIATSIVMALSNKGVI
jgi:hypothetical protein